MSVSSLRINFFRQAPRYLALLILLQLLAAMQFMLVKYRGAGVPLITRCTIVKALGDNRVKGGQIARLDENCQIIESSVETVDVDTICIAVGLKPYARLASLAGCKFGYFPQLGGWVPLHNDRMMTTVENVYGLGT